MTRVCVLSLCALFATISFLRLRLCTRGLRHDDSAISDFHLEGRLTLQTNNRFGQCPSTLLLSIALMPYVTTLPSPTLYRSILFMDMHFSLRLVFHRSIAFIYDAPLSPTSSQSTLHRIFTLVRRLHRQTRHHTIKA